MLKNEKGNQKQKNENQQEKEFQKNIGNDNNDCCNRGIDFITNP